MKRFSLLSALFFYAAPSSLQLRQHPLSMAATPPQLYMVIRINTTLLLEKRVHWWRIWGLKHNL